MTATKEAGTTVAPPKKAALTFDGLLERMKPQLEKILPKHLTAERMVALCALAATKTPKLKECTPLSLFNAVMNASRLGLEIGQHAHLVPFKNSRAGVMECVFIPDYRGLIGLAVRSERVKHIDARVVYKDDEFDYQLGDKPFIRHKPKLDGDRSEKNILCFYTVAHLADGTPVFDEPMSKAEVDGIRNRSRAKDDGPWVTDFVAMGKKTVIKRLCKFLPQTPELAAAIELDTRAETGEVSTVSDIIDSSDSINQAVADSTRQKAEDLKAKLAEETPPADGGRETREPGDDGAETSAPPPVTPEAQRATVRKGPMF
jgi:recombination protein RecT